jgi:hypothetical protein
MSIDTELHVNENSTKTTTLQPINKEIKMTTAVTLGEIHFGMQNIKYQQLWCFTK